jgi:pimeloyl-ACP methyl ester carboxylesterase
MYYDPAVHRKLSMQRIASPAGATVFYDKYSSGPPLILVHGSFSDHKTNWEFVKSLFEKQFTVYAIARRGLGERTPLKVTALRMRAGMSWR